MPKDMEKYCNRKYMCSKKVIKIYFIGYFFPYFG